MTTPTTVLGDSIEALLVDPRGEELAPTVQPPRLERVGGASLGLLDNTKWNAAALLQRIAGHLDRDRGLAGTELYRKPSWGQPASDALCQKIADECQAVITASAD